MPRRCGPAGCRRRAAVRRHGQAAAAGWTSIKNCRESPPRPPGGRGIRACRPPSPPPTDVGHRRTLHPSRLEAAPTGGRPCRPRSRPRTPATGHGPAPYGAHAERAVADVRCSETPFEPARRNGRRGAPALRALVPGHGSRAHPPVAGGWWTVAGPARPSPPPTRVGHRRTPHPSRLGAGPAQVNPSRTRAHSAGALGARPRGAAGSRAYGGRGPAARRHGHRPRSRPPSQSPDTATVTVPVPAGSRAARRAFSPAA